MGRDDLRELLGEGFEDRVPAVTNIEAIVHAGLGLVEYVLPVKVWKSVIEGFLEFVSHYCGEGLSLGMFFFFG